jgi:hypothetical protein
MGRSQTPEADRWTRSVIADEAMRGRLFSQFLGSFQVAASAPRAVPLSLQIFSSDLALGNRLAAGSGRMLLVENDLALFNPVHGPKLVSRRPVNREMFLVLVMFGFLI